MFKFILIYTFFLSICCHISAVLSKNEIAEKIESIPITDRKIIEKFFRNLLFHHPFAYTLFGDKPVSNLSFDLKNDQKPQLFRVSAEGYETWKKYAHLFPSSEYLFLFNENLDEDYCEITLINKKAFEQIINKYRDKFSEVFGSKVTAEKILDLLLERQSLWNTSMKERDDLIGILLGFGKVNAELFQKRNEIESSKTAFKRRTKPSIGYHSIEEELKVLNSSLQFFENEPIISLKYMRLPGFMANLNHEETIQLKRKYKEQRKRITHHYAQGDVLEITLERLCQ